MSHPCFILNIFLYVYSIKKKFVLIFITRLDFCICNWSAD